MELDKNTGLRFDDVNFSDVGNGKSKTIQRASKLKVSRNDGSVSVFNKDGNKVTLSNAGEYLELSASEGRFLRDIIVTCSSTGLAIITCIGGEIIDTPIGKK